VFIFVPLRESPPALTPRHGYAKVETQKPGIETRGAIEKRHGFTKLKLVNLSRDTTPGDCLVHPQDWEQDAHPAERDWIVPIGCDGQLQENGLPERNVTKSPTDPGMKEKQNKLK
jgi:hypothetical protein